MWNHKIMKLLIVASLDCYIVLRGWIKIVMTNCLHRKWNTPILTRQKYRRPADMLKVVITLDIDKNLNDCSFIGAIRLLLLTHSYFTVQNSVTFCVVCKSDFLVYTKPILGAIDIIFAFHFLDKQTSWLRFQTLVF